MKKIRMTALTLSLVMSLGLPCGPAEAASADGGLIKGEGASYVSSEGQVYGWLKLKSGVYYLDPQTGETTTGLSTIAGKLYYFDPETGAAVRGWVQTEKGWYYFGKNYSALTEKWIGSQYVGEDGLRVYGWVKSGSDTYYTDEKNGVRVTGWETIDGETYYFDPTDKGAMLTSVSRRIDGVDYRFDEDGKAEAVITLKDDSEDSLTEKKNKKGKLIVQYALKFIGRTYRYGGSWNGERPYTPTDCSGFTQGVMAHFGISIPRTAEAQARSSRGKRISTSQLLPGDLIFYSDGSGISHVAIYIGAGKIVHASNSKPYPAGGIKISNYNYRRPVVCKRFW